MPVVRSKHVRVSGGGIDALKNRWTIALMLAASATAAAQTPTVFATGLKNPSKIITGPSGSFLVTEADTPTNSGRVTRIDSSGVKGL